MKQALLPNGHEKADQADIVQWAEFMDTLRVRDIPINIHCDLGNNDDPTMFLHLVEKTLESYPDNKIVWSHMGLSRELTNIDPDKHIKILTDLLDRYPKLWIDLSWDVLWDSVFFKEEVRAKYISFLNAYPTRFLTGTDFVASANKSYKDYKAALEKTSYLNLDMNDEAFRYIALGENYFRLLNLPYKAPEVCPAKK
ncbi:MAG: amidohydrolase family protein [Bacteroidota bacterium]